MYRCVHLQHRIASIWGCSTNAGNKSISLCQPKCVISEKSTSVGKSGSVATNRILCGVRLKSQARVFLPARRRLTVSSPQPSKIWRSTYCGVVRGKPGLRAISESLRQSKITIKQTPVWTKKSCLQLASLCGRHSVLLGGISTHLRTRSAESARYAVDGFRFRSCAGWASPETAMPGARSTPIGQPEDGSVQALPACS